MGVTEFSDELFDKAYKEKKAEDESKNLSGGVNREYVDIKYSALNSDILKFVRIVGVPIRYRNEYDPYFSPKLVYLSWILDDEGNKCRIIWPNKKENPDWPLYRVMNKVMSYEWDKSKDGKNYFYDKEYPGLFYRVFKNIKIRPQDINSDGTITDQFEDSLNPYERGWLPTQYVMMNVIDRSHMEWHKENKHTLVLSKKMRKYTGKDQIEKVSFEPGVPYSVYDQIMGDDIVGTYHSFINYDVIIKKLDREPYYKVYHPENEKQFINPNFGTKEKFIEKFPFYDPEVHLSSLTKEEESWERYNFDHLYQITSYSKIKNRLGHFIKNFDKTFNENIYEEIEHLSNVEKKEWTKTNNENESKDNEDSKVSVPVEKDLSPESNKEVERPTRKRRNDSNKDDVFDLTKFDPEEFKGLKDLTEEQKSLIIGYDPNKKSFEYNTENIYQCVSGDCPMAAPESYPSCPLCGEKF